MQGLMRKHSCLILLASLRGLITGLVSEPKGFCRGKNIFFMRSMLMLLLAEVKLILTILCGNF